MNRLRMITMCLLAMMAANQSAKAQEVTITLFPGWNWISYPKAETQDISMALGDFEPVNGDMLKSQFGNAVYSNGYWRGSVTHFIPGWGYKYYSNRTEVVSFVFGEAAPQLTVTTAEPTEITMNSAICGGNVVSGDGNYVFVILKGICWSTNPNPTFNDNYVEAGNGLGGFTASLTGLALGTTYYVRAFAVTLTGTFYGEEVSFSTDHEYVDLGLPSGNLWATCNMGAQTPEDYGDYFAWGETLPKSAYSWGSYQYCNGSISTITKYCNDSEYGYNGFTDSLTILLPIDDAATVYWGTDWHMPTKEEWEELYTSTTVTWTTQNGVNGRLFTASNGNSLFLPATGCFSGANHIDVGSSGYYWSSSLYTDNPSRAWRFSFDSGGLYSNTSTRWYGYTVRAVHSVAQNASIIIDVTANPVEGGEVSGGGNYQQGDECTLIATANDGYVFTNWTENDEVISTDATYTFTVDVDRALVANFMAQTYTITVSSNPSNGGSVSGGGSYIYGQSCTVSASATTGYTFTNWTEYGEVVSIEATYIFTVNADRTLVANFATYVDLGLPSGLLWATCNIGADTTWDYGNYFAWGETQPKTTYNWNTYLYCNGSVNTLTKYCSYSSYGYNGYTDNLHTLVPNDDAATANWNNGWRMPTYEDWVELYNNTTITWKTENGVNGRRFTASNGNSIFLPSAGYRDEDNLYGVGSYGYYWSSSLDVSAPPCAWYYYFKSDNGGSEYRYRCYGLPVRAVRSAN